MPIESLNAFIKIVEDLIKAPPLTIHRIVLRFDPVIVPSNTDMERAIFSEYIRIEKISQGSFQILHYPSGVGLYETDIGYCEILNKPLRIKTSFSRKDFQNEVCEIIKTYRDKIIECHSLLYTDSGHIVHLVGNGIFNYS